MRGLLDRIIDSEISPMVYVTMGVSVFIGFCFVTGLFVGTSESILYSAGVLVHKKVWGLFLFITATLAELGFIMKNDRLMIMGGISGFCAWLFACIALAMQAHWYIMVTVGVFQLLFHGYVYLATSQNYIRREPKYR